MGERKRVVLAFSGGLDTSFCVPWLIERGYDVITLFVDTGGVGPEGAVAIAARAEELGAIEHVSVDVADRLWETFVVPFVMGGVKYQDRYPLLCSDRYVIVEEMVRLAHELGADAVAHGCTAMGNDQVRFDHTIAALTNLPVLAPIRAIQSETDTPRAYEIEALAERGFSVDADVRRYTINENLLGVTVSGSEIDEMGVPGDGTYRLTNPPGARAGGVDRVTVGFESGIPVKLDGVAMDGAAMLRSLQGRLGVYGIGRGIYTGDTIVGLKGRIVFEAPGIEGLLVAHKALEELTLTATQNAFKPGVARRWGELVFGGGWCDPLREDLEAFVASTQRAVTGEVVLELSAGSCVAVAVRTEQALVRDGAVYAQSADWSADQAEGFIRLHGQSQRLAAARGRAAAEAVPAGGV
ncbi:MAG: argininosuccinate synthase [Planctomycetota bacterium]